MEEFISIKSPYQWYIQIDDKDVPTFLDYEIATNKEQRDLLSVITPTTFTEVIKYKRKVGDTDIDVESYITNRVFKGIKNKEAFFFKFKNNQELLRLSKVLKTTIYIINNNNKKIAMTTNPFIVSEITNSDLILHKKASDYKGLGEIEKYINIKVLIKEKMNKQSEFVNFKNGNYTPLK